MKRRALTVGAIAVLAVACTAGPTAAPAVPQVFDLSHDVTTGIPPVDPGRADVAPADQLRLALEQQMAWHGITLVEAMRAAELGDGVASKAWIRALSENTDALVRSIGLAYGPVGARAFQQQWAQHTQFLVDYATAVGRSDTSGERTAKADLASYVRDQGSFLATATGGRLSVKVARSVLAQHVHDMIVMVDAAARSDRASSTRVALADHTYLNGVADALTGAIAAQQPQAFPGPVDTPTAIYCTAANQAADAAIITDLGTEIPAPHSSPTTKPSASPSSSSAASSPAFKLLGGLGPLHLAALDPADRSPLDDWARSYVTARRHDSAVGAVAGADGLLTAVAHLAAAHAPT